MERGKSGSERAAAECAPDDKPLVNGATRGELRGRSSGQSMCSWSREGERARMAQMEPDKRGRVPQQARGETDGGAERQLPRWREDTNHLRLAVCSRKLSFSYHHCL
ncbi:hypothetical protein ATANTOWER_016846 [Ataeniobius toweri]|uniref:Uncharacterized protein n=1 Tax=Ataeniobius toweri TaxID=208326 RepID=A0ABU7A2B5_9TELE|nr:hypothetical protein [Ataeniobius toweri]